MSSESSLLEEMLERATNSEKESDELTIQMFCVLVRSNNDLIHKAQEMLIQKIRSNNTAIALKALSLMAECMSKCGTEFQDEAAKFRFLNELIRLVSNKYEGHQTPVEIKQRIMKNLLLWTAEFPKKVKIKEAYEMLQKEGISDKDSQILPNSTKKENVLGIDEEMLAKLIKSETPENLERANLLIQHRVNQEARKADLICQHKSELQEINNIILILNEMLDKYSEYDEDAAETMKELYKNCKKHKQILKRMPELLDNTQSSLLAETVESNEMLQLVINRYKSIVQGSCESRFSDRNETHNCTDLLKDLLKDEPVENQQTKFISPKHKKTFDELCDIFGSIPSNDKSQKIGDAGAVADILCSSSYLQPTRVVDSSVESKEFPSTTEEVDPAQKLELMGLQEIDRLSEELLKQSLQQIEPIVSKKSDTKKLSLNDLAKENNGVPKLPEREAYEKGNIDCGEKDRQMDVNGSATEVLSISNKETENRPCVVHLSDINIDLDEVKPISEEISLLNDSELEINMVYTENKPSKNVTVIVLTALNKSSMEIKDFQIEASVKKPSKVRLLHPTDTYMGPKKPFRQPSSVIQILLLFNPTGRKLDITLLIGYKLDDDPDPIKDSLFIKDIPYVD